MLQIHILTSLVIFKCRYVGVTAQLIPAIGPHGTGYVSLFGIKRVAQNSVIPFGTIKKFHECWYPNRINAADKVLWMI